MLHGFLPLVPWAARMDNLCSRILLQYLVLNMVDFIKWKNAISIVCNFEGRQQT